MITLMQCTVSSSGLGTHASENTNRSIVEPCQHIYKGVPTSCEYEYVRVCTSVYECVRVCTSVRAGGRLPHLSFLQNPFPSLVSACSALLKHVHSLGIGFCSINRFDVPAFHARVYIFCVFTDANHVHVLHRSFDPWPAMTNRRTGEPRKRVTKDHSAIASIITIGNPPE